MKELIVDDGRVVKNCRIAPMCFQTAAPIRPILGVSVFSVLVSCMLRVGQAKIAILLFTFP